MSSRTKKSKREPKRSEWSEWEWKPEHNCFERSRKNEKAKGGFDWEYAQPEAVGNAQSVPRSAHGDGAVPLQTGPDVPSYIAPNDGTNLTSYDGASSNYTHNYSQNGVDPMDGLSRGFENASLSDARHDDGKGKQPENSSWRPNPNSAPFSQSHSQYPQSYPIQSYHQGQTPLGYIQEENRSGAGALTNQYPDNSYSNFAGNSYSANPYYASQGPQSGYGQESSRDPVYIGGDDAEDEELSADYKTHFSKEFKNFKVFKMVWHETRGENNTFGTETVRGKFGQPVNGSIRRFIIIKADKGHCLCLPILTYNRQATKKPGLIVDHHGQIYTGRKPPDLLRGEGPLTKLPVCMIPKKEKDALARESRINYAKVYTVEHNVRCVFVGTIDDDDRPALIKQFNDTLKA